MKPITRKEYYLAKAAGTYTGPTPSPVLREDYYLATLSGDYSGNCPAPVTRIEKYMSAAAGLTTYVPQPVTRIEKYWYAIAKGTGYVPEPVTREEKFLYAVLKNPPKPEYLDKTAEGNPILLTDSAEAPLTALSLYGWSKQDGTPSPENPVPIVSAGSVMTTGAQLFDASKLQTQSVGGAAVTNNGDGSFTVSGSGNLSSVFSYYYDYSHEETIALLQAGKTIKVNKQSTIIPTVVMQLRQGGTTRQTVSTGGYTITEDDIQNPDFYIRLVMYGGSGAEIVPGTYKPMVYQDGDGTWEPYTGGVPGINPYEGEINVTVQGGNLLDADQYYEEYKQNDGTYIISANEMGIIRIPITEDMLGKQYTFSASGIPALNDTFYVQYYENANKVFNGNVIREGTSTFSQSKITFIPEEMGGYIRLTHSYQTDETVQVKDIMLNSGASALPYEPYKQPQTLTIPTPGGLPGIPVTSGGNYTDESGQQWICDEVDFKRGKYVQRVKKVTFDGSEDETWSITGEGEAVRAFTVLTDGVNGIGICNRYIYGRAEDGGDYFDIDNNFLRFNCYQIASSIDEWKTWLQSNSVTVLYPLATPIETDLSAEEIAAYKALHTYSPTTTVSNNAGAWMKVGYKATP